MPSGLSKCEREQLSMQRLGHISPQTVAGSGLYCSTSSSDSLSLPWRISAVRLCVGIFVGQANAQGGRNFSLDQIGLLRLSLPVVIYGSRV